MSGIYLHIPFCASRCIYCDFYSTTLKGKAQEYVDALLKEYDERSDFLPDGEPLRTIYIGGGTPSQLPVNEICRLIKNIIAKAKSNLPLDLQEITIEANPEDITEEWAKIIGELNEDIEKIAGRKILRISLGVQSLIDSELKMLNRRHNSHRPAEAVRFLRESGIENISLDLMYGLPNQTIQTWEESVDGIIALAPEHISAYCLSIEEGTRLEKLVSSRELSPADDELCLEMAELLRKKLRNAGYFQYEISNYCRPGFESRHNSNYWNGTPYLGLGPGAHSYDGDKLRVWNEPNLQEYLYGNRKEGRETLSDTDLYNEKIMLGLRTAKGVDVSLIKEIRGRSPEELLDMTYVTINNNRLSLTESGLAIADEIIRELMV